MPNGAHRQMAELDRDYDEYRRENQSRFDREFGAWREKRGEQRQAVGRVREDMEVVGSDGGHVGTVDCTRGDRIILTRSDEAAGGVHHVDPLLLGREASTTRSCSTSSAEEARRALAEPRIGAAPCSSARISAGAARTSSTAASPAPIPTRNEAMGTVT